MGGQPPQGWHVHHVTPVIAGPGQPGLDAAGGAEQPLMAAGVHHVIPHVRGRDQEVRDLLSIGRAAAVDAPDVRAVAGRARGRDQDLCGAGQ